MRIAIAGAGIAGLTTAIALATRGFEVEVFEKAPELREVGAGIQLAPNATRILERLDVLPALAGKFSEPGALAIRDSDTGNLLYQMPLGQAARARYGAPYATMSRADLQQALLGVAARHTGISLNLGAEVRGLTAGSEVTFESGGKTRQADAFLAADGVQSTIRREFFRYPGPRALRRSAWRAIISMDDVPSSVRTDEVGLWLGRGCHIVHYAVQGGRALNVVVIAAGDAESKSPSTAVIGKAALPLVGAGRTWTVSPLLIVDPEVPAARGPMALVGDAAHAMAPTAAQGGAMAIEDAWVLADAFSSSADPQVALRTYAEARRTRVLDVARLSSRNLNFYEVTGVPASVRNSLLKLIGILPATLGLSRLDWLFGWHAK